MKILVIGGGGREHAIAHKLAQSPQRPELYFAPGNPGMAAMGQRLEIEAIDIEGLVLFAEKEEIDLTVVGPEAPLALGITDAFHAKGLKIFGPPRGGARIEASKSYAKRLMSLAQVPTAAHFFCETEADALKALDTFAPPYVIKQDGLAAGKGVTIAASRAEAEAAIKAAMEKKMPVVIEEFLQGEELSLIAICDGKRAVPLLGAQDFKRAGDNDQGPNTGGMGAYAPVPLATPAVLNRVREEVLEPMMRVMTSEGIDYRGVLYAGLMVSPQGEPKVIEFNARFGDPETQVLLPLLDEDLAAVLMAAAQGDLSEYAERGLKFRANQSAVTVVLASEGYPDSFQTGFPLELPTDTPEDVIIFHAGTKILPDQSLVTQGGRVLNVTAMAATLEEARQKAYATAEQVRFQNKYCRRDIAAKAVQTVSVG